MNNMKTIFLCLAILMLLVGGVSYAGSYLDSAHGTQNDAITGVKRLSAYTDGHCAHCHEQHASIDGSEPSPTGGPDGYLLFNPNHTSQTINFCFDCHVDASSQQDDDYIYNHSYSYRAGGWTDDPLDDILQAFTYGTPPNSTTSSSHDLNNIKTFINGKWGYTANSNPCIACHNPHAAQRGWPVTLPSKHGSLVLADILWGDDSGEKMSDYATGYTYQAPYRLGSITHYEPDGSTTTNGTNLTDYVTFCTDCHNYSPTPFSTRLGNTKNIDWAASIHGGMQSWIKTDAEERKAPYNDAAEKNYVMACTDCHEPHGSPNYCYKIRKEVNGGITTVTDNTNADWDTLCSRCHLTTHEAEPVDLPCIQCHYHGANVDLPRPLF